MELISLMFGFELIFSWLVERAVFCIIYTPNKHDVDGSGRLSHCFCGVRTNSDSNVGVRLLCSPSACCLDKKVINIRCMPYFSCVSILAECKHYCYWYTYTF